MTGIELYNRTAFNISKLVTENYSTSFSLATSMLNKKHRDAIYAIYGFVRFADEIVDSFHGHDQKEMLNKFEADLNEALDRKISLNPILHSFQQVVNEYKIPYEYIEAFLTSMRFDLRKKIYSSQLETDIYIYGSADVVGLMCLHIFCDADLAKIQQLRVPAMKLGSAFQKVNFLRDLKNDAEELGRIYFHHIDYKNFTEEVKKQIVDEIEQDFELAVFGMKLLPNDSKIAVSIAYFYYKRLLHKLKKTPASRIQEARMRISNPRKVLILLRVIVTGKLRLL